MCCFLLSLPLIPSSVSVVFDFNASLIDVAPFSPILLSVDLVRIGKSGLLIGAILLATNYKGFCWRTSGQCTVLVVSEEREGATALKPR